MLEVEQFFDEISSGLNSFFDSDKIIPKRSDILNDSILKLKKGIPEIFDEDLNIIFNRKQRLFDIYDNNTILDLSNNENFVEYFLDDNYNISDKKQVLLRRMLMGLTSYYPIDRSSIVNMPEIIEPTIISLIDFKIVIFSSYCLH